MSELARSPALRGVPGSGLRGLYGRPFLDLGPLLAPYVDLAVLPALHEELCMGLTRLSPDVTGGSHRSMGIMPPGHEAEALVDYGEVIAGLDAAGFETLRLLADDPSAFDPAERAKTTYGEERAVPLSRRQLLWLKYRHGVYFPWKVYVELMPNRWWSEKHLSEGKRFTRLAESLFPKTLDFVRQLPFESIGRCNLMGLEAHDHGTLHRDGEPDEQTAPDEFITFSPAQNKTLVLWDPLTRAQVPVAGQAVWFNDFDYHGVLAAPWFRYSIRVDGVFRDGFVAAIAAEFGGT